MKEQTIWAEAKNRLVSTVVALGFPAELGEEIAKHLGSPTAMERMTLYLQYSRPKDVTIVVDEMLAIREEIDAWREKKESLQSNAEIISYDAGKYFENGYRKSGTNNR